MQNCFGAYSRYGSSTSEHRHRAEGSKRAGQAVERWRAAGAGHAACIGAAAVGQGRQRSAKLPTWSRSHPRPYVILAVVTSKAAWGGHCMKDRGQVQRKCSIKARNNV